LSPRATTVATFQPCDAVASQRRHARRSSTSATTVPAPSVTTPGNPASTATSATSIALCSTIRPVKRTIGTGR
jgi:hypothetical protein